MLLSLSFISSLQTLSEPANTISVVPTGRIVPKAPQVEQAPEDDDDDVAMPPSRVPGMLALEEPDHPTQSITGAQTEEPAEPFAYDTDVSHASFIKPRSASPHATWGIGAAGAAVAFFGVSFFVSRVRRSSRKKKETQAETPSDCTHTSGNESPEMAVEPNLWFVNHSARRDSEPNSSSGNLNSHRSDTSSEMPVLVDKLASSATLQAVPEAHLPVPQSAQQQPTNAPEVGEHPMSRKQSESDGIRPPTPDNLPGSPVSSFQQSHGAYGSDLKDSAHPTADEKQPDMNQQNSGNNSGCEKVSDPAKADVEAPVAHHVTRNGVEKETERNSEQPRVDVVTAENANTELTVPAETLPSPGKHDQASKESKLGVESEAQGGSGGVDVFEQTSTSDRGASHDAFLRQNGLGGGEAKDKQTSSDPPKPSREGPEVADLPAADAISSPGAYQSSPLRASQTALDPAVSDRGTKSTDTSLSTLKAKSSPTSMASFAVKFEISKFEDISAQLGDRTPGVDGRTLSAPVAPEAASAGRVSHLKRVQSQGRASVSPPAKVTPWQGIPVVAGRAAEWPPPRTMSTDNEVRFLKPGGLLES
eukprot:scaffold62699_cov43-Prasinocladus_malaysianus.AAC.1